MGQVNILQGDELAQGQFVFTSILGTPHVCIIPGKAGKQILPKGQQLTPLPQQTPFSNGHNLPPQQILLFLFVDDDDDDKMFVKIEIPL